MFELLFTERPDRQWAQVERLLEEVGAQSIRPAAGDPPQLVTALLPEDIDADAVLRRLRAVEGIGRAEVDAIRETSGEATAGVTAHWGRAGE